MTRPSQFGSILVALARSREIRTLKNLSCELSLWPLTFLNYTKMTKYEALEKNAVSEPEMPQPGDLHYSRNSRKPHFIGRFSAYSLMEKLDGRKSVRLIGFRNRSPPFAYVSFSSVNIARSFVPDCRSPFRFAPIRDILGDRFGDRMEINDGMSGNLTALKVQRAKPGKYSDGGNLYLVVSRSGSRKWVLRFTWRGGAKEMGLGSATTVSLGDARKKATNARRKIVQGLNPIEDRKRDGGIPTFGEMADDVRETLSAGFRNEKHKAQWKSTLETYAAPLRAKPVDTIATDDVLAVLKPIWATKAETASRVRGRIEKVFGCSQGQGLP